MIRRYMRVGATTSSGAPVYYGTNNPVTVTPSSATFNTTVLGTPGAVVTFKVTAIDHTNPGFAYQSNGLPYNLNDTFDLTIGGAGVLSFTNYVNAGTSAPGNRIVVTLVIIATTLGSIQPYPQNTAQFFKVT